MVLPSPPSQVGDGRRPHRQRGNPAPSSPGAGPRARRAMTDNTTPRPWRVFGRNYVQQASVQGVARRVALFETADDRDICIRAVNAHDDLVAALADFVRVAEAASHSRTASGSPSVTAFVDRRALEASASQARAALAKARA